MSGRTPWRGRGIAGPRWLPAFLAAAPLLATADAAPTTDEAWQVAVGVDGAYRAGSWTPVRVVAAPGAAARVGEQVVVWAEDPDGRLVGAPPALLRDVGGGLEARAVVRPGRPSGRLLVQRLAGQGPEWPGGEEHLLPAPIPSDHEVLVVFGALTAAGRAARLMRAADAAPITVVAPRVDAPLAVGAEAIDYDLADAMIVCGRSVAALPPAVVAGIDAWVRDGGRLVFCAGASALGVAAAGGAAADWLPGPIERLVPLRRVAAIETFARGSGLATRPGVARLQVPLLGNRHGIGDAVEMFEGSSPTDLPLAVRFAHGFGVVTWIGLDLDDGPFPGWSGTDTLLVRLLGGRRDDADAPSRSRDAAATDLTAQLRRALERSGGPGAAPITTVPFEIIIGLGLLYVLALYPLDWWIASRGRPWVAWLTLPALVALCTAAVWGVAEARRPAASRLVRTAEVIDIDIATRRLRSHGWGAVWSGDNATFDVTADRAGAETALSWFADAGAAFGGIDATIPHPALASADAHYVDSLARLDGVAVAAAANRLFQAEGRGRPPTESPLVHSTLARDAQGVLRGAVSHSLPFTLENCRLAHGGWLYDIGSLPPGRTFDAQSGRGPRSLAGALQRRAAAEGRDAPTRWDAREADPLRILEIAGFHGAAGGAGYTRMPAGRLRRLDLSPLLTADRAVLVGTVSEAVDAWTTAWSFTPPVADATDAGGGSVARLCRIVIPLARAGLSEAGPHGAGSEGAGLQR
jgi:hypothetical protein